MNNVSLRAYNGEYVSAPTSVAAFGSKGLAIVAQMPSSDGHVKPKPLNVSVQNAEPYTMYFNSDMLSDKDSSLCQWLYEANVSLDSLQPFSPHEMSRIAPNSVNNNGVGYYKFKISPDALHQLDDKGASFYERQANVSRSDYFVNDLSVEIPNDKSNMIQYNDMHNEASLFDSISNQSHDLNASAARKSKFLRDLSVYSYENYAVSSISDVGFCSMDDIKQNTDVNQDLTKHFLMAQMYTNMTSNYTDAKQMIDSQIRLFSSQLIGEHDDNVQFVDPMMQQASSQVMHEKTMFRAQQVTPGLSATVYHTNHSDYMHVVDENNHVNKLIGGNFGPKGIDILEAHLDDKTNMLKFSIQNSAGIIQDNLTTSTVISNEPAVVMRTTSGSYYGVTMDDKGNALGYGLVNQAKGADLDSFGSSSTKVSAGYSDEVKPNANFKCFTSAGARIVTSPIEAVTSPYVDTALGFVKPDTLAVVRADDYDYECSHASESDREFIMDVSNQIRNEVRFNNPFEVGKPFVIDSTYHFVALGAIQEYTDSNMLNAYVTHEIRTDNQQHMTIMDRVSQSIEQDVSCDYQANDYSELATAYQSHTIQSQTQQAQQPFGEKKDKSAKKQSFFSKMKNSMTRHRDVSQFDDLLAKDAMQSNSDYEKN